MAKKKGILDRLKDGPVLGDGGYCWSLKSAGGYARVRSLRKSRCSIPTRCVNCMSSSAKLAPMFCRR